MKGEKIKTVKIKKKYMRGKFRHLKNMQLHSHTMLPIHIFRGQVKDKLRTIRTTQDLEILNYKQQ